MSKNFDQIATQAAALSATASENAASVVTVDKADTTQSVSDGTSAVGSGVSVGDSVAASAAKKTAVDAYSDQSAEVQSIVNRIELYAINMGKGKRQTPSTLLQNQTDFVRTIEQLVNLSSNGDFAITFRRLLTVAYENKDGAFGIDMIHRRISELKKSDSFIINYTRFIDMVIAFSDNKNRALFIRRYNLDASVQFIKPQYRERCIEFVRSISGR